MRQSYEHKCRPSGRQASRYSGGVGVGVSGLRIDVNPNVRFHQDQLLSYKIQLSRSLYFSAKGL